MDPEISAADMQALAERLGEALRARNFLLATAESCTGGWASMAVTAVPGSSAWFERGFVTYSNAANTAR
jgi:nicotinamide-nucleotide amidase